MRSGLFCVLFLLALEVSRADAGDRILEDSPKVTSPESGEAHRPPTVSLKESKEHVIKRVAARNSPLAMAAHVAGTVMVGVEVSVDGKVTQAVILSGPEMLRAGALEAAKLYEYRPFLIDGVPRTIRTAIEFRYAFASSTSF